MYIRKNLIFIWRWRGFIFESVKRDFRRKYSNSIAGTLWAIFNSLALILMYTFIFSEVMRSKILGFDSKYSYSIYLCSGILIWGVFSEILTRMLNVFIEYANFIKKIKFPRACLPIIVTLTSLVNFFIIFTLGNRFDP